MGGDSPVLRVLLTQLTVKSVGEPDYTPPHINSFHFLELCPYIDNVYCDQRRDREIAKLLITVVLVFIACHSFRMVLNVYEVFHLAYYGDIQDQWPAW